MTFDINWPNKACETGNCHPFNSRHQRQNCGMFGSVGMPHYQIWKNQQVLTVTDDCQNFENENAACWTHKPFYIVAVLQYCFISDR